MGWWEDKTGREKVEKKNDDKIEGGPDQTFLDRFRLYARLAM